MKLTVLFFARYLALLFALVLTLLALTGANPAPRLAAASAESRHDRDTASSTNIPQVAAGGHILRFGPNSIDVAGISHLLHPSLVNAHTSSAVSDRSPTDTLPTSPSSPVTEEAAIPLAGYDPAQPESVDATITWNTFLGSNESDFGLAVAVDASGNVYVAGQSAATWGSPIRPFSVNGSNTDAFVAKLDSSGNLIWNTFLGGSGPDGASSLALDPNGNIYVAGTSRATWGSPVRPYIGGGTLGDDAFVAKLDSNGNLVWNTFLGGSGDDEANALTVDSSANVFVVGTSFDAWGSPVRTYTSGADVFAAKLDSSGNLIWNTFLGGTGNDFGGG
jgi:hypothetical protein